MMHKIETEEELELASHSPPHAQEVWCCDPGEYH